MGYKDKYSLRKFPRAKCEGTGEGKVPAKFDILFPLGCLVAFLA